MYQIFLLATQKVVAESLCSEREARAEAIRIVGEHLRADPKGQRVLGWCKHHLTWEVARSYCVIQEMIGVWVHTDEGRVIPDDVEDDECLLFKVGGKVKFGTFDSGQQEFCCAVTERTYPAEKVTCFLVIPEE